MTKRTKLFFLTGLLLLVMLGGGYLFIIKDKSQTNSISSEQNFYKKKTELMHEVNSLLVTSKLNEQDLTEELKKRNFLTSIENN
jgi:hypothetical protein